MSNAAGGRQSQPTGLISREAARDLSSYQYCAMLLNSAGRVDYASTGQAIGVLQNAPAAAYREAEIATEGTTLMYVDGGSVDVAVGDKLGSNSAHHGAKVTTDTSLYFCVAMEAVTEDNYLAEVKLVGPQTISA